LKEVQTVFGQEIVRSLNPWMLEFKWLYYKVEDMKLNKKGGCPTKGMKMKVKNKKERRLKINCWINIFFEKPAIAISILN